MGCLLKANGLYSRMTVGAVLLAAGAGSRLGGRPKALLELGGVPLVLRQLIALSGAGVDEVVVVLGHHAEAIEAAVRPVPDHARAQPVARRRPGLVGAHRAAGAVAQARRGDRRAGRPAADRRAGHHRADRRVQEARRRVDGGAARDARDGGEPLPGNPVMFDAALREEWLAGAADLACRKWRERIPSACAGSTPTTGATASTSTRPKTCDRFAADHRPHADVAGGAGARGGRMTDAAPTRRRCG